MKLTILSIILNLFYKDTSILWGIKGKITGGKIIIKNKRVYIGKTKLKINHLYLNNREIGELSQPKGELKR